MYAGKEILVLTYVGIDSYNLPYYKDQHGNEFVDVNPWRENNPQVCEREPNEYPGDRLLEGRYVFGEGERVLYPDDKIAMVWYV